MNWWEKITSGVGLAAFAYMALDRFTLIRQTPSNCPRRFPTFPFLSLYTRNAVEYRQSILLKISNVMICCWLIPGTWTWGYESTMFGIIRMDT